LKGGTVAPQASFKLGHQYEEGTLNAKFASRFERFVFGDYGPGHRRAGRLQMRNGPNSPQRLLQRDVPAASLSSTMVNSKLTMPPAATDKHMI
jgi:hypothetical protein